MHFSRKVSDFGSGQACVFENVMEEIQSSWDLRCCIPGSIPAGRHLTPISYLPAALTKIIAAFLKRKNQSYGSQLKGDSFLRHLGGGGRLFSVTQNLSSRVYSFPAGSSKEWIIECAAENIMTLLYRITKVSLFLFLAV